MEMESQVEEEEKPAEAPLQSDKKDNKRHTPDQQALCALVKEIDLSRNFKC